MSEAGKGGAGIVSRLARLLRAGRLKYNLITIRQPPRDGDGLMWTNDTEFVLRDGTRISHVKRAVVTFEPEQAVVATIDIAIDPQSIEAHPMLGIDTVREAAEYYGYDLVKVPAS